MEYYNFNKTRLQEQSRDYYRNLSEEKKERKTEYAKNIVHGICAKLPSNWERIMLCSKS